MAGSDDELARTATAGPSGSEVINLPAGSMLGRYRLERELGSGGMGVVHAAFDPDLERRVALKVLRTSGADEAKKRLLREARAMARLAHPNVVTVHEVGTANGRDYVAMEIVDGDTLADWLRAQTRAPAEIVEAFVAAGRGLAAAHAAGIVHRDFKPHNVLRSKHGRIVVTDFGLAREVTDPLAVTRPITATGTSTATATPSTLSGLTVTGSLLGTPAYMAPEQWNGGAVTAATDQFAFCVALWEALSGSRPYPGPTVEDLRAQAARGPSALDASKIPRRLRDVLRRGLDPDPSRRWSSVEALLAQLAPRGGGRSMIGAAIGAAVLVAGGVVVLALSAGGSAPAEPACIAPALDPAKVWSPEARKALVAAGQGLAAAALDRDIAAWEDARRSACAAEPPRRGPWLSCLDGVLARIDTVARASETLKGVEQASADWWLIDPAVCAVPSAPRVLVSSSTPGLRDVIAAEMLDDVVSGPADMKLVTDLVERVAADPCASAWARAVLSRHTLNGDNGNDNAYSESRRLLLEAEQDAERCGDDRIRAEIAMVSAQRTLESHALGALLSGKLRFAETAIARVSQSDLVAQYDHLRSRLAARSGQVDQAIELAELAAAGFSKRGMVAANVAMRLEALAHKQQRGRPDDMAAMSNQLAELRALAIEKLGATAGVVSEVKAAEADWAFASGDIARADALRLELRRELPQHTPRRVSGRVIDDRGQPVAGATVTTGRGLGGDSISAAMSDAARPGSIRVAITRADGTFEIADAASDGVAIAQRADLRSLPVAIADNVELVLAPTSRIEGRIELSGQVPTSVVVMLRHDKIPDSVEYGMFAPVLRDGTFSIDGAPRGRSKLVVAVDGGATRASSFQTIDIKDPVVRGLQLKVPVANRTVHVIVRSTVGVEVPFAVVLVAAGKLRSTNLKAFNDTFPGGTQLEARQLEGERAPQPVRDLARPGDLYATSEAPAGPASACAVGFPADFSDPQLLKRMMTSIDKIEIRCVPIPDGAKAVVVEVPPAPRFD
ncbi:MAG: serine/threonine-protein kinase [Kofleriaceae bacterium]